LKEVEDWEIKNPAEKGIEKFRKIRGPIRKVGVEGG